MMTDDVLDMLNRGRLDAAVIAINVNLRRTAVVPMYDEPLVVLIPADHPWAGRDDVSPAELDDQELLMLDEGNCLRGPDPRPVPALRRQPADRRGHDAGDRGGDGDARRGGDGHPH